MREVTAKNGVGNAPFEQELYVAVVATHTACAFGLEMIDTAVAKSFEMTHACHI